jgi:hypothetical protein
MTRRKAGSGTPRTKQRERELVLMGDVREVPFEVREGGRTVQPVVALWVGAEDGYIFGQLIDEPGRPAETLVRALSAPAPVPGQPRGPVKPSKVILFNEELARQVKALLADQGVEVLISPPFEPLDDLFADLFDHLRQALMGESPLDLPDEVLMPLISPAERLWRAKPWEYTFDYPPFSLIPQKGGARLLHASILGANEEVFGVALYTSAEDYEATLELGESSVMGLSPEDASPAEVEAAAAEVLEALRHRAFLVSFEPRDEAPPDYRGKLARGGWPGRLSKVPVFSPMGGGSGPGLLTAEEAAEVAVAVDALVAFCQRHRGQIAGEKFPIRDSVEVDAAGKTVRVDVSVPGEDPSAPPATVYRFKVSLSDQKSVWRRIDVRSDQTLEDLHYAIQDAFGWDDDHLYAFYLSGKAWDQSTEYVRPEGREPGMRTARVRMDRLGLRQGKRFLYIFDFGDEWRHEIRIEKAGLALDAGEYPRIIEGHGEAPPQYGSVEEDLEEDE